MIAPTRETPRTVEPEPAAIAAALEALEAELRVTLRLGAQAGKVRAIRNAVDSYAVRVEDEMLELAMGEDI